MPREVQDIRHFIQITRRKDAKAVRIKRCVRRPSGKVVTKFKIRCTKYLYTLVLDDLDKAHKLQQSLPPKLVVTDLTTRRS